MNPLWGFETACGHPFLQTGMMSHLAHQCLHRHRAVHQPDAVAGGVAVDA
ncbi:MAG: hypothetical protein J6P54_08775 [Bacteroidales bacterium]|nr:hypothetical protein [Bacteroidales bacterium]